MWRSGRWYVREARADHAWIEHVFAGSCLSSADRRPWWWKKWAGASWDRSRSGCGSPRRLRRRPPASVKQLFVHSIVALGILCLPFVSGGVIASHARETRRVKNSFACRVIRAALTSNGSRRRKRSHRVTLRPIRISASDPPTPSAHRIRVDRFRYRREADARGCGRRVPRGCGSRRRPPGAVSPLSLIHI